MRKLLKLLLFMVSFSICYIGLPGIVFLICYLCGLTEPGKMSGHWTDNAGGRHEPQEDITGILFTFALMCVALIVGGILGLQIADKIDKIKD
jgi:hypothetical protein